MQRFTISIDDDLAQAFDLLMERRGYKNRSEAFRDMIRKEMALETVIRNQGECVAVVSYLFDHHRLQLSEKMTALQHEHAALVVSSMHVHVNSHDCVETVVMRGPVRDVSALAKATVAERGIENGAVHLIPLPDLAKDH